MEKFKIGDVVVNKNNRFLIFEIGQIFEDSNGNQVLRSIGFGEIFYELDSVNAVYATKDEKIKYYEDKIKAEQSKLDAAKAMGDENTYLMNVYKKGQTIKNISRECQLDVSEKQFNKIILMLDMDKFVKDHCPDWKPDWNDDDLFKCGIGLYKDRVRLETSLSSNRFSFGISVPNQELSEKMLVEFGGRLKEWY